MSILPLRYPVPRILDIWQTFKEVYLVSELHFMFCKERTPKPSPYEKAGMSPYAFHNASRYRMAANDKRHSYFIKYSGHSFDLVKNES